MNQQLAAPTQAQTPAVAETAALISVIERAATNPDVNMDKMERLLVMQERIFAKNAEMAFNASMTDAQSNMRQVSADATNPQTRSQYASYSALDKAIRPVYTQHGFSLSFDTADGAQPDWVRVVCYVSHRNGHSRTYHVDMPADGKGAKGGDVMTKTHAAGSAMSYGMRYLLKLIFNVAVGEDDDDGNAASEMPTSPRITAHQVADLKAMMEEVKQNESAMLKHFKIARIEDMRVTQLEEAILTLERKRKNNAASR